MDKLSDNRPGFFMVEDAIFEFGLTPFEGWVYMAILKHANRQTKAAFPGIATLTKLCHMSRAQVIRCIKALEAKGILEVHRDTKPAKGEKRRRESNHYIVKSLSNSVQQTPPLVSGSNYPGVQQTPPLVSGSNLNQSKETKVKEPERKAAPKNLPSHIRGFEQSMVATYHPLIEAWRDAHYAHNADIPKPMPSVPNDAELAISADANGFTTEQVYAATLEKLKNGKTNVKFKWLIDDLPDYLLRQSKSASKPKITPMVGEVIYVESTNTSMIWNMEKQRYDEYEGKIEGRPA